MWLLMSACSIAFIAYFLKIKLILRFSPISFLQFRSFFSDFSIVNKLFFYIFIFLILILLIISPFNFPHTDTYHWEMPKYWLQHNTIKPFEVLNFSIIRFSFLQETQYISFFAFLKVPELTYIFSLITFTLTPFIIARIALSVGFSYQSGLFAGFILCSFTVLIRAVYDGANDYTTAFWVLASLFFALHALNKIQKNLDFRYLLLSVLAFSVAAGIKNSTMILLPVYILFLIFIFRTSFFSKKVISILFFSFVLGFILSGVLWIYISNYLWYGDIRGFDQNYQTILGILNFESIKGRIIRGLLYMISDFGYLSKECNTFLLKIHFMVYDLFNVPLKLPNEAGYYSFNSEQILQRNAFGIAGTVLIIPTMIVLTLKILFDPKSELYHNAFASLLLSISILIFVLYHALLNWQPMGLFRLTFVFILVFAPLFGILYYKQSVQIISLVVATLNILLISFVLLFISIPTENIARHSIFNQLNALRLNTDSVVLFHYTQTGKKKPVPSKRFR